MTLQELSLEIDKFIEECAIKFQELGLFDYKVDLNNTTSDKMSEEIKKLNLFRDIMAAKLHILNTYRELLVFQDVLKSDIKK